VTPAQAGFRWPAEWEPHAATWLSWPHNDETWPGRLPAVERAFAQIVVALCPSENVCINVLDAAMEDRVRKLLVEVGIDPDLRVRFFPIATDDAWIRDHGPVFVVAEGVPGERERALIDFRFNAWGEKYPPWDRDDAVPAAMAKQLGLRKFDARHWVLEAGSIDGNGSGCVLATESCLLNPNRNRGADGAAPEREEVEAQLASSLACEQVLWLGDGIAGDDTDGHIDDIARFIAPDRIAVALEEDPHDDNYAPLRENWQRLRVLRNDRGQPFDLVPLPMPPPIVIDGQRCPASYANFYLANETALVPVFDVPSDTRALAILADCLPGRDVVGISSRDLVVGLGAVHCLTQQEPL
jgi:agmatine deiminase